MSEASAETTTRIQALMKAGAFDAALSETNKLLEDQPEHQDGLYMAAVCARYLKRFQEADECLQRLKLAAPDFGRAFQEEGHLNLARGDADRARHAFLAATRNNPALLASWKKLAELSQNAGDVRIANEARAQLSRLQSLPRELLAVLNHLHEGRILRAEEIVRAFLQKNPRNVEGMRLLADIGSRLSVLTDADFLLETAIELEPENLQLRIDHIQVLRKRQKYQAAYKQAEFLFERDQNSPVFQSLFAIESMHAGKIEQALDLFDKVLAKNPKDHAALTSKGHALKTFGRTDDAIAAYRTAIEISTLNGDAWYALANLKTYRFTRDDITAMQRALNHPDLPFASRIHLNFALGKALEDARQYDQAFAAYKDGNALKKRQTRYTSDQMQAEFDAQKKHLTRELFQRRCDTGHDAPDPIFILGLPRAGSTLLEQILASHSMVDGTLELPNILSLAHRLRGRNMLTDRERYPRILNEISDEDLKKLGEEYIETTRVHRGNAPFFTDKMPNNFRHIGLIHLILPNAKIIDARRNPLDCCWSGFKQLFAEGQEFTYGLEEIGHYYRGYVDLMDHWHEVLPKNRILKVQHEDVLEDLDGQVRRILDYCGLPFENTCVDFHKTDRPVRTASSEQVRQPINTSGLEQWRPFEAHLHPLKEALGPALTTY
jgi:tetratricopeptide (TPR) repeat protein